MSNWTKAMWKQIVVHGQNPSNIILFSYSERKIEQFFFYKTHG